MPREGEVLFGIDRLNDGAERDVFVSGPGDWAVGFFANCERAFEFDAEPGAKFVVVGEGAPDAGDGSIDLDVYKRQILECARQVLEVTGSSSRIRFAPLPEDDPVQRRPDITKARLLLGWEPKIDLRTCLLYTSRCV